MSKTNCVNCGAAKDTADIRCPFCGTTYLDFTAIDFEKNDPVVCQFVLPYTGRTVMSMLARPVLNEISMTTNTMDITSLGDTRRYLVHETPQINVEVSFVPLARNGVMATFRKDAE